MLTCEEDVEVSALHHRGWTISAIARHLGRSRNTRSVAVQSEDHASATALPRSSAEGLGTARHNHCPR